MADVAAAPMFKKRSTKASTTRKRAATPPAESSDSDASSAEDGESGVQIKRRKREGGVQTSSSGARTAGGASDLPRAAAFAADRSTTIAANEDATRAANWYTDAALAAQDAARSGASSRTTNANARSAVAPAGYGSFIEPGPNARTKAVGPVKAPSSIRAITVTDFAPDVCKDYKQTGFCGFGDSCKFLHAREDYAQGWQLDKAWEKAGKGRADKDKPTGQTAGKGGADEDDEEKMLREIPFACVICKQSYTSPVVTKCGHYFCEKCAMGRYVKEKKKTCAACGADTGGSFAVAKKLKDLLEKKRRRMEERRAQAREAGEEVSDDGDDGN